jgi:integrase
VNLTKSKKTGTYSVSFRTVDGRTKTITTRTSNRIDARRIVKASRIEDLEFAARAGRLTNEAISYIVTGKKITMAGAIPEWAKLLEANGKSQNWIKYATGWMQAFIRDTNTAHLPPTSITVEHVNAWVNAPTKSKASSRSVMLSAVRSFFKFANGSGWCVGNPANLAEVNLGKLPHAQKEALAKATFTEGEVKALIAAADPGSFWRAAIAIGRWTGLRISDIAGLEWASFEKMGKIIVWTQKRDRRVELPLEPNELWLAVLSIKHEHLRYVFPEQQAIISDPKRRSWLSKQFERLCLKCGIRGKSFHSFRHTRLTELVNAGMSLSDAALVAGHSSTATTSGYIHRQV